MYESIIEMKGLFDVYLWLNRFHIGAVFPCKKRRKKTTFKYLPVLL